MKSVSEVLVENKTSNRGSLVGYYPAGFPTVEDSIDALVAMCEDGVDILEIGVPYSDPVMDGEVIQKATETALENGFKLNDLFRVIKGVRERVSNPILVMTYWNPVLSYGVEKFAKKLKESGAQGLITPDLIPDEADEWLKASDELGLDRVFLVAPSSSQERVKNNSDTSSGFVYAVSTMGITGERSEVDKLAREVVSRIKSASKTPTCVGVGISTAAQVRDVNGYADGAIVGTAFIKSYQENGLPGLRNKVSELVGGLG